MVGEAVHSGFNNEHSSWATCETYSGTIAVKYFILSALVLYKIKHLNENIIGSVDSSSRIASFKNRQDGQVSLSKGLRH